MGVHQKLYRELKEWFGLTPRIALDCYRDALANAKDWRRNPHKGKRPRVKRLSMPLHQGSGYRIKEGYVEIIGGSGLRSLAGIGDMISMRAGRQGLSIEVGR